MWGCPMKKFSVLVALSVFCLGLVVGCDDSSSASGDNNETSAVESSSSMSTDKEKSSDSKTKQSNSSGEEQNSSNTEKMSSSSQKNSSKSNSSSSIDEKEPRTSSSGSCKNGETRESDVLGVAIQYDHCENGRWVIDSTVIVVDTSIHYTFHPNLDSLFNPDVAYGVFKDERDGNEYKTVTFVEGNGDIRTMFAQNLNYGTFVKLGENSDAEVQKHCYDDDEWYCDHYFGGLYTWSEAFGFPRACDTIPVGTSPACPDTVWYDPDPDVHYRGWKSIIHKQGICPGGWHILTYDEWVHAVEHTSILNAMSKTTWWYEKGSTNRTGISLMATGYVQNDSFVNLGEQTAFWYSVIAGQGVDSIGAAIALEGGILATKSNPKAVWMAGKTTKETAFPIRCVMDKE